MKGKEKFREPAHRSADCIKLSVMASMCRNFDSAVSIVVIWMKSNVDGFFNPMGRMRQSIYRENRNYGGINERMKENERDIQLARTHNSAVSEHANETPRLNNL